MHKCLFGIGFSDHTKLSRGAVEKSSSSSLASESTTGRGESSKFRCLWTIQWSGGSAGLPVSGRQEGRYCKSLVTHGVKGSFSYWCHHINVSRFHEWLRQIIVDISVRAFIMEVLSLFKINFQSQQECSWKIWFIGPVKEVFTMEESLVDLGDNHHGPVISGHLDPITYSLYSTVLWTKHSV